MNKIYMLSIAYSSEEMEYLIKGEYTIIYLLIMFFIAMLIYLSYNWFKQFFDM